MTTPYKSFTYLTPPRTESKRDAESLGSSSTPGRDECNGWWAQIKKNGTNSVIFVDPDRNVVGWNRHSQEHRAWQFTEKTAEIFRKIPGHKWFVFNGELLHNKTPRIKNIHYLYDLMVCDGEHLTGTTYAYRYQLLCDVLAGSVNYSTLTVDDYHADHIPLDAYTRIARNYTSGFRVLFDSLTASEDEGLVLKNPLGRYFTSKADTWMVKYRRPEITKLY